MNKRIEPQSMHYCLNTTQNLKRPLTMKHLRSFVNSSVFLSLVIICSTAHSVPTNYDLYGKLHLSSDIVSDGSRTETAMASNGSRFGIKGRGSLAFDIKTVWKLESGIDLTGETTKLTGRNRFIGIVGGLGTLIAGYHDTPYKSFGRKSDLMVDTLADNRSVIGSVSGFDTFNIRAQNAIMYVSPTIAGLEVRALYSPGESLTSQPTNSITSTSAVYKTRLLYLGAAYEEQGEYSDTGATRIGAGLLLPRTKFHAIFERLDSGTDRRLDRDAYGLSFSHRIGDTSIKAQAFTIKDEFKTPNTGGSLYALAASQKLAKEFEVYAIIVKTTAKSASQLSLSAQDHGESYLSSNGNDITAASMGMVYRF